MLDTSPQAEMRKDIPVGAGLVRRIGWMTDEDTQAEIFRAWIDFPNGPPDLKFNVIIQQMPVLIVLATSDLSPEPTK